MERKDALATLAGIGAALILGGVALAAATQSGTEATARAPGPGGAPGLWMPAAMPHGLLGPLAEQLKLSGAQRQAIRGCFEQARPGLVQLRRQLEDGTELLARTAPDDPAYQSVVANVSQSAADLAARFVLQTSQLRAEVHALLTPEQRSRLAALEAQQRAALLEQRQVRGADELAPPRR
ncbi:MAG TPA: hypothetical protein VMU00_10435 [Steroidobacteraceae bacterium]|nr:hypothetical protein [Steroidobacteraceae bacterium]